MRWIYDFVSFPLARSKASLVPSRQVLLCAMGCGRLRECHVDVATQKSTSIPDWVAGWFDRLQPVTLTELSTDPSRITLFSTDMLVGFCRQGSLVSDRVGALETPVARLFELAWRFGVRDFVLTQDTHSPVTPEFEAWPVHCLAGTEEPDRSLAAQSPIQRPLHHLSEELIVTIDRHRTCRLAGRTSNSRDCNSCWQLH